MAANISCQTHNNANERLTLVLYFRWLSLFLSFLSLWLQNFDCRDFSFNFYAAFTIFQNFQQFVCVYIISEFKWRMNLMYENFLSANCNLKWNIEKNVEDKRTQKRTKRTKNGIGFRRFVFIMCTKPNETSANISRVFKPVHTFQTGDRLCLLLCCQFRIEHATIGIVTENKCLNVYTANAMHTNAYHWNECVTNEM